MLVHPGGPFWAKKDAGSWSIPKGLADEGEDLLAAAKREFLEETGMAADGDFLDLGAHKQPGGKTIVSLGLRRRFRHDRAEEQHLLAGMAAALRQDGRVPGGRQSRVAFDRRSAGEDKQRPDVDPRRPGQKARGRGARPEGRAGLTRQGRTIARPPSQPLRLHGLPPRTQPVSSQVAARRGMFLRRVLVDHREHPFTRLTQKLLRHPWRSRSDKLGSWV